MPIFDQERDELPGATSYRVEILLFCLYTELRGDNRSIHKPEGKEKDYNELRFLSDKLHDMHQK